MLEVHGAVVWDEFDDGIRVDLTERPGFVAREPMYGIVLGIVEGVQGVRLGSANRLCRRYLDEAW